jgi:hypothetical protein
VIDRLSSTGQRLRAFKATSEPQTAQLSTTLISKRCNCDPSKHTPIHHVHHHTHTFSLYNPNALDTFDTDTHDIPEIDFSMPISGLSDLPTLPSTSNPYILSPQSQPIPPPLTVVSALYLNGRILGLSCSVCITSTSPHPLPHHPPALQPTITQLTVEHPRWYDRLPFPRMRDGLIRLVGVVDEEDLLNDLFTKPSWRIEGIGDRAAWDPGAWRVERGFEGKWGWLWA